MFDYLIVGAGFAGSVLAERLAAQRNQRILLIDRRKHVGGNAYDCYNEEGILIQKYGPHIFHTNSAEVFAYLSQFMQWRPYEHRVLTKVGEKLLPLPINLDTINQLYGWHLNSEELQAFFTGQAEPRERIQTAEDTIVSKIGRELYETFFRAYTRKQWGCDPSNLDASVTARIPIRVNCDDRYFTDRYQAMPLRGYASLFARMLDHPNITVLLETDYQQVKRSIPHRLVVYTGPIDEFFKYCYGQLPYQSLEFVFQTFDTPTYQQAAVINYPNEQAYTRITEFKYLTGQHHPKTTIVYEYPRAQGDPYYPVPSPESREMYRKYKTLAETTMDVHFVGRLGTYSYYNMDQVIAQALAVFKRLI